MLKKPFLFTLKEAFKYDTGIDLSQRLPTQTITFGGAQSQAWWLMITMHGLIVINKNYAWDGCSPKFELLGHVIGTPDGGIKSDTRLPVTYDASLVHDALCQFADDPKMPFSRAEIDALFYSILKRDGFQFAGLYYAGVRAFVNAKRLLGAVRGVFS